MEQTRLESFVESALNTLSGYFISLAMWLFVVAPIWDVNVTVGSSLSITAIFTVSSMVRSYVIRRWFNNGFARVAKIWVGDINGFFHK